MPYYKEKNILFIHIPKTGGTVIENQLKTKFKQSLYGGIIRTSPYNGGSPQHLFYKTIFEHKEKLNVDFQNIKVFCVVRNPYDRILSFYFWSKGKNNQVFNRNEFINFIINPIFKFHFISIFI